MEHAQIVEYIESMPDDVVRHLSMPVVYSGYSGGGVVAKDEDGAPISVFNSKSVSTDFYALQAACWEKFNSNPQVSSSVRDTMGRMAGEGFNMSSHVEDINDLMEELMDDPRNNMLANMPKYAARSVVEGELHHCLTVHPDGFVEVDFVDPSAIKGGADAFGIYYHPSKPTMPLFYEVELTNSNGKKTTRIIPSVNIARYPELIDVAKSLPNFPSTRVNESKAINDPNLKKHASAYKPLGGYCRFIISWDKSYITKRNLSHLCSVLEWCNYYEQLKRYEIDHKKAAGAYLWVTTCSDPKLYKQWLALTPQQKAESGMYADLMPGGRMMLPPGFDMQCRVPNLPNISGSDTDIMEMVTSGMNAPNDMVTGSSKGSYSSIKASRGPQADRMSDEIAYFRTYLTGTLWRSLFFIVSEMRPSFKNVYKVRKATGYKNKKAIVKNVDVEAYKLVEISFPSSQVGDLESQARGLLGVKHGSINATLGIPNSAIASRLGFSDYHRLRLIAATEEEIYPELQAAVDQESGTQEAQQETVPGGGEQPKQAEPKPRPVLRKPKKVDPEKK